MGGSARYQTLSRRFRRLRQQFIPAKFSATGIYPPEVLDRARAFRLLLHAEIEHFFEDRAIEIADRACAAWTKKHKPSNTLLCLLSNFRGDSSGLPKKLGTKTTASSVVNKCVAQFRFSVTRNNGIKTENLLGLFLPIGVDESNFDVTWLAALDTFGTNRGAAAHSSWVTYSIDPKTELALAEEILKGLKEFDEALNTLRRNAG